jgi:hypothetical protein
MGQTAQFRKILPVSQVVFAVLLGGWGEWLRYTTLNRPFFGGTWWDSTARFHVWPWPLKIALVVNLPVLVGAGLVSVPLDAVRFPAIPEWLFYVMMLPFVALLWY